MVIAIAFVFGPVKENCAVIFCFLWKVVDTHSPDSFTEIPDSVSWTERMKQTGFHSLNVHFALDQNGCLNSHQEDFNNFAADVCEIWTKCCIYF